MEAKNLLLEKDPWISYLRSLFWCNVHCWDNKPIRTWGRRWVEGTHLWGFQKGSCFLGFHFLREWGTIALDKSPDCSVCCRQWCDNRLLFFLLSCCEFNYELALSKTKYCRVADSSSLFMMPQWCKSSLLNPAWDVIAVLDGEWHFWHVWSNFITVVPSQMIDLWQV